MSLGSMVLRGVTGAWILNSAYGKLGMGEDGVKHLQGMAEVGIPDLGKLSPSAFKKFIIGGEVAVGSALLLPFVPNRLAGAALSAFSGGMLSMYFRNPEWTQQDGIRWSQEGTPFAKDMWLGAIAADLMLSGGKKSQKRKKSKKG